MMKVLNNAGLLDAKNSSFPMDPRYEKLRVTLPKFDNTNYQKLVGSLLYICVNTRPDISAPVCLLSQHIKDLKMVDWNELKIVCRYLKGDSKL